MLLTTSVGIAMAPADGDKPTTILRHAAIALARAKGDGGQRMCFFEQSMDKALQRRMIFPREQSEQIRAQVLARIGAASATCPP